MIIKDKIQKVESSDAYEVWRKENPTPHLAHIFVMLEKPEGQVENESMQVGYYDSESDMVTVFVVNDEVSQLPESEIFKEEHKNIKEIDLNTVNIDLPDALEKALSLAKQKYAKHEPDKVISILQIIEGQQMYNITIVTKTFNMINIRIDTQTEEIISDQINSIFDLKKDE